MKGERVLGESGTSAAKGLKFGGGWGSYWGERVGTGWKKSSGIKSKLQRGQRGGGKASRSNRYDKKGRSVHENNWKGGLKK